MFINTSATPVEIYDCVCELDANEAESDELEGGIDEGDVINCGDNDAKNESSEDTEINLSVGSTKISFAITENEYVPEKDWGNGKLKDSLDAPDNIVLNPNVCVTGGTKVSLNFSTDKVLDSASFIEERFGSVGNDATDIWLLELDNSLAISGVTMFARTSRSCWVDKEVDSCLKIVYDLLGLIEVSREGVWKEIASIVWNGDRSTVSCLRDSSTDKIDTKADSEIEDKPLLLKLSGLLEYSDTCVKDEGLPFESVRASTLTLGTEWSIFSTDSEFKAGVGVMKELLDKSNELSINELDNDSDTDNNGVRVTVLWNDGEYLELMSDLVMWDESITGCSEGAKIYSGESRWWCRGKEVWIESNRCDGDIVTPDTKEWSSKAVEFCAKDISVSIELEV